MNEETHTCAYCGAPATHQMKNGKWCCCEKRQSCPANREKVAKAITLRHNEAKEKYGTAIFTKGSLVGNAKTKAPSRGDHICVYCGGHADFQLKDGRWCCHKTRHGCPEIRRKNSDGVKNSHASHPTGWNKGHPAWNKGLTAAHPRISKSREKLKLRYQTGELIPSWKGRKHTEEQKRKISESMKKASFEGRTHNIGQCRWERKHSYPEEWLIGVIANEFSDKQYICEMSFHRFALDFAWVHKKKCIEVDGGWHDRPDQQERDRCKDELLRQEGWQVLRMPWKEVLKDKQGWIAKAKEFIDS